MDETPDDVLVMTQKRSTPAWGALALLGGAAVGVTLAVMAPARTPEWWIGAALVLLGVSGAAFLVVSALRPARLTIGADGIDLWQVFGARSMAWEEVAAVGHRHVRLRGGKRLGASGVRIALLDGADIDLPAGWHIADDDLIELLTAAWQDFTAAQPAGSEQAEPVEIQPALVPHVS